MNLDLDAFLSGHVFAFMLVFTRLGAGMMMFPGIGESFVSARIRMIFALALSFLVYPVLLPSLPAMPAQVPELVKIVGLELVIGMFFGAIMRLLMDILETAGSVIAMNIGLSNAMVFNPSLATQSALPSAFLGSAAIVLVFSTGLDHLLFRALLDTYKVFPPGEPLLFGDLTQAYVTIITKSFIVAIQMASPFIIMELLLFVAVGVMQKLMSQIQLFIIVLPAQIWGGLFAFSACITIILGHWLVVFDDTVGTLFVR